MMKLFPNINNAGEGGKMVVSTGADHETKILSMAKNFPEKEQNDLISEIKSLIKSGTRKFFFDLSAVRSDCPAEAKDTMVLVIAEVVRARGIYQVSEVMPPSIKNKLKNTHFI